MSVGPGRAGPGRAGPGFAWRTCDGAIGLAVVLAMVVWLEVRLEVKERVGDGAACGGHKMGGGSLGMVRLRAGDGTAMGAYLRRTKVRRQEHSFDEHP